MHSSFCRASTSLGVCQDKGSQNVTFTPFKKSLCACVHEFSADIILDLLSALLLCMYKFAITKLFMRQTVCSQLKVLGPGEDRRERQMARRKSSVGSRCCN